MTILSIIDSHDKLSKKPAHKVNIRNAPPPNLGIIVKSLKHHMDNFKLDVICASHIGVPLQIALVRKWKKEDYVLLFNTTIVSTSVDKISFTEGSPFYVGLSIKISRPASCRARTTNINGITSSASYESAEARLLQIIDSVQKGISLITEANYIERSRANKEWMALQRKNKK